MPARGLPETVCPGLVSLSVHRCWVALAPLILSAPDDRDAGVRVLTRRRRPAAAARASWSGWTRNAQRVDGERFRLAMACADARNRESGMREGKAEWQKESEDWASQSQQHSCPDRIEQNRTGMGSRLDRIRIAYWTESRVVRDVLQLRSERQHRRVTDLAVSGTRE